MVAVLLIKPILLLGGAGYLAYRLLRNTVKPPRVGEAEGEFTGSGGIEMKPCAECGMYIRSDAAVCPRCIEPGAVRINSKSGNETGERFGGHGPG